MHSVLQTWSPDLKFYVLTSSNSMSQNMPIYTLLHWSQGLQWFHRWYQPYLLEYLLPAARPF